MKNYRSVGEPTDSGLRKMAKAIRKNPPHQDWLLMVLGTIQGDHPVFAKDYVAPKKVKNEVVHDAFMVQNEDDFFDDLPEMPEKLGKRNFSFMS